MSITLNSGISYEPFIPSFDAQKLTWIYNNRLHFASPQHNESQKILEIHNMSHSWHVPMAKTQVVKFFSVPFHLSGVINTVSTAFV